MDIKEISIKDEIEIKEKILVMQHTWIETADSKVIPLFAVNATMLSVLITLAEKWFSALGTWEILLSIFVVSSLLLSMLCLARAIFPQLKGGPKESNIFFGGIAKQTKDIYISNMSSLDATKHQRDILEQIYCTAKIATFKYKWIKLAFICTMIISPFWLIDLYVLFEGIDHIKE